MLPIVGFLPPHDPRVLSTVLAIASHLTDRNGLVRRYLGDEIEEAEGAFLLCTFWLAHALALTGHVVQARKVFQTALAHANDVGLLAEETDPDTGEALGNFLKPSATSDSSTPPAPSATPGSNPHRKKPNTGPRHKSTTAACTPSGADQRG